MELFLIVQLMRDVGQIVLGSSVAEDRTKALDSRKWPSGSPPTWINYPFIGLSDH